MRVTSHNYARMSLSSKFVWTGVHCICFSRCQPVFINTINVKMAWKKLESQGTGNVYLWICLLLLTLHFLLHNYAFPWLHPKTFSLAASDWICYEEKKYRQALCEVQQNYNNDPLSIYSVHKDKLQRAQGFPCPCEWQWTVFSEGRLMFTKSYTVYLCTQILKKVQSWVIARSQNYSLVLQ